MNRITFFRNFKDVIEHAPLEVFFNRIQIGHYRGRISPLRMLYREGKCDEYNQAKKFLIACTISGMFDGVRRSEFLTEYSYYMVFDIDDLSDEYVVEVKNILMLCNYVLACFLSPSGNGLKVVVQVSTGAADHLPTFLALQQYLQILTGVEIDPSGKDVTRLCFVSDDPDLYFNPEADIYTPPLFGSSVCVLPPPGPKPVLYGSYKKARPLPTHVNKMGVIETYQGCINYVSRYHTFVEGQRNDFVFALAMRLRKAGLAEEFVTFLLLIDYNYNEREVRSTIKSAFKYMLDTV